MQAAVETNGLTRSYGERRAVASLNLSIPRGSVFGFLGPNGAGKTTTLRLILGLALPDSGRITVLGLPMPQARIAIARRTGALIETPSLYDHLTGRENLRITAGIIGTDARAIDRVLGIVRLVTAAERRVAGYSLGMRQRLALARALLGAPDLLILDEPTNGLDPEGMAEMRTLLRELPAATGATVVISSHLLSEVEQTVSHVALMRSGRLIAQGTLACVLKQGGSEWLRIEVDDLPAASALLRREGLHAVGTDGALAVHGPAIQAARVNALLIGAGIGVSRLAMERPGLAEAYRRLSGTEADYGL